jgi:hypothetical protein
MAHKIGITDLIDYKKDIVLCQSTEKPLKMIIQHTQISNQLCGGLRAEVSYRVLDTLGKIRHSGDHLQLAVNAYNKLYNE